MKTFAAVFLSLIAVIVVSAVTLAPSKAAAWDSQATAMASTDAGPTNSVLTNQKSTYVLQCVSPAAYGCGTTSAAAGAAAFAGFGLSDAGTAPGVAAYRLNQMGSGGVTSGTFNLLTSTGADGGLTNVSLSNTALYEREFSAAGCTYVAAVALDAGNPNCHLYLKTYTP